MAGPLVGEQEYYVAKLKAMAPPGRVVWTGMLNEKLRWGALVGADALILPSGREEFGESAVAALSVGTAVLLSDKVAVGAEILGAGAGLAGTGTIEGVRALLTQFCATHTQTLATMSASAKKCYAERFAPTAVAQRLDKILKEVLPAS
jgi:glycosyltransferase involved in cell wall biosynthesis